MAPGNSADVEMAWLPRRCNAFVVNGAFTPGTTPQHLNYQAALTADFVFGTGMVQHRPVLDGLFDDRFVKEAA